MLGLGGRYIYDQPPMFSLTCLNLPGRVKVFMVQGIPLVSSPKLAHSSTATVELG